MVSKKSSPTYPTASVVNLAKAGKTGWGGQARTSTARRDAENLGHDIHSITKIISNLKETDFDHVFSRETNAAPVLMDVYKIYVTNKEGITDFVYLKLRLVDLGGESVAIFSFHRDR